MLAEIKMNNVRAVSSSFTWGLSEDIVQETNFQPVLRNCFRVGEAGR